jgi:NAD(P)-dependent dehydrogenase (short-subunit alcohol dehydrogenase family)
MRAQGQFAGKTALVTGAGRGLGLAMARALVAEGARVAINDVSKDHAAKALAELGESAVSAIADLAQPEGPAHCVDQAVAELGRLDIIISNAAVNIENPIESTTDELWDLHLAVVLRAPHLILARALPELRRSKGVVLNIASELGLHAIPNNVAYVSAKHGLVALTRALAIELAASGIRVNALCPGTMDTELMRDCAEASGDPEGYYAAFNAYHPLGRIASPQEVADFAVMLVSPRSAFMTGAAIAFDGGSTAGRAWTSS